MRSSCRPHSRPGRGGFTVVEMLVSVAILAIILLCIFGVIQQTSRAWKGTSSKATSFQAAQAAFEALTSKLSQATLNTFYDYYDDAGAASSSASYTGKPARYGRQSDLHFICGKALIPGQIAESVFFQLPQSYSSTAAYQGGHGLLNACGFFLVFGPDPGRPPFLDSIPNPPPVRYRYRLMQFIQPTENLGVYAAATAGGKKARDWFATPVQAWLTAPATATTVQQLAENIVAFVVSPRLSSSDSSAGASTLLGTDFEYDSSDTGSPATLNQMPPLLEVILIAIDETSAHRIEDPSDPSKPPPLIRSFPNFFQTASHLDSDLSSMTGLLSKNHVTYRVFRTMIPVRGAKWSL